MLAGSCAGDSISWDQGGATHCLRLLGGTSLMLCTIFILSWSHDLTKTKTLKLLQDKISIKPCLLTYLWAWALWALSSCVAKHGATAALTPFFHLTKIHFDPNCNIFWILGRFKQDSHLLFCCIKTKYVVLLGSASWDGTADHVLDLAGQQHQLFHSTSDYLKLTPVLFLIVSLLLL